MPQWQMFDEGWRRDFERRKYRRQVDCHSYISAKVRLGMIPAVNFFACRGDCGRTAEHYHHPNYRYPDYVVPLCTPCHWSAHMSKPPDWGWLMEATPTPPHVHQGAPKPPPFRREPREPKGEARAREILGL